MREKSDEITHLKTREMSLIDKSDTLEKGQILNIIYYMWYEYFILWSLELGFSKDETQAYKKVSIATRRGNLYNIHVYNINIIVQEVNTTIQHERRELQYTMHWVHKIKRALYNNWKRIMYYEYSIVCVLIQ